MENVRKQLFRNTKWYHMAGDYPGNVSVTEPGQHSRQRRYLAHAFSSQSLRSHEAFINHYVGLFIRQIGRAGGSASRGINLEEAFNRLTFDIIGTVTGPP